MNVSGCVSALLPGGVIVKFEESTATSTFWDPGRFCCNINRNDFAARLVAGFWRIVFYCWATLHLFEPLIDYCSTAVVSGFLISTIGLLFESRTGLPLAFILTKELNSRIFSGRLHVFEGLSCKMHVVLVDRRFSCKF